MRTDTPEEINARYADPVYRCFSCRTPTGLHWYRDTSCPICSRPECIAACDAQWNKALSED